MMQEALEGQTLGHYQLQRRIGYGGMSEVYLAADTHEHRDIAVKIVHHGRTDDLARFQREVEMLTPLAHEHILPVYDSGQERSWHYLAMPYIEHGTLADRLHTSGPFTPDEAGVLLDQLASALQYAHDRGILHRDIKPSNILLRDDAYAYLSDFGIAKSLAQESSLTQTGFFIGTPEYMAPELFETQATQASDIYALGILLYAMLIGKPPFTAPNPLAIIRKHLQEMPIAPSQLNPAISLALEQVMLRALEKDPQRRFQSAQAFAEAYRHALHHPEVLASQSANATSGPYTDSAVEAQPTLSASFKPYHPAQVTRTRRSRVLLMAGLLALLLVLPVSLVATLSPGKHAGSQLSASSTHSPTVAVSASTATASAASTSATQLIPPALTSTASASPTATQLTITCTINDAANVLNQSQICPAGRSPLSHMLVINSSNAPGGKGPGPGPNPPPTPPAQTIMIIIVVNPSPHGHGPNQAQVMITGGSALPLTNKQYHSAQDAFNQAAHSGDYTSATLAAIQSLQASGA